jgi:hypothetical protein
MAKVLIIGNGKAGQRHFQLAERFGLDTYTADPYAPADYPDWRQALQDQSWDYVVIASPPAAHIEALWACADKDVPTLCEKPLYGLGTATEALWNMSWPKSFDSKLYIAYNFAFHPGLLEYKTRIDRTKKADFKLLATQSRVIPPWGMLLDNISHDLFIIDMLAGINKVTRAWHVIMYMHETWTVMGTTEMGDFIITDSILTNNYKREAFIDSNEFGSVDIDANPQMFTDMWQAFITKQGTRNLAAAKKVQGWLQDAYELNKMRCGGRDKHNG